MAVSVDLIRSLAENGGALAARAHPHQRRTLQRLRDQGVLASPFPGIFVHAENRLLPEVRIRAAVLWAPDAVLTGTAAARCSFWPDIKVGTISLALPQTRPAPRGYLVTRSRLPTELVRWRDWAWLTVPGLTAIDLVAVLGGAGIDQALRVGAASLAEMYRALELTPGRPGNTERRLLLHDSRDEPWSEAERLTHRLIRGAGFVGWETNWPVVLEGQFYRVDVAFPALRVAIEIDGYDFHKAERREQFERDRAKASRLTAAGWRVLRFTWRQLCDSPEWVLRVIRETCALAAAGVRR